MSEVLPPILNDATILARTSQATRHALIERASPAALSARFLPADLYALLQQITATLLPQKVIGTEVDVAACIDRRLLEGTNAGWRFAELPADGEAYVLGLTAFATLSRKSEARAFDQMSAAEREEFLQAVAGGTLDHSARFPLSTWLGMLKTDAVKFWMSHPTVMQKIGYYGFADGLTGLTNGPTETEGWIAIAPDTSLPFEQGSERLVAGREA